MEKLWQIGDDCGSVSITFKTLLKYGKKLEEDTNSQFGFTITSDPQAHSDKHVIYNFNIVSNQLNYTTSFVRVLIPLESEEFELKVLCSRVSPQIIVCKNQGELELVIEKFIQSKATKLLLARLCHHIDEK